MVARHLRHQRKYLLPGVKITLPPEFVIRFDIEPNWAGNCVSGYLIGLLGYESYADRHIEITWKQSVKDQMTQEMINGVYADVCWVKSGCKSLILKEIVDQPDSIL